MQSYRSLLVWQRAMQLALAVYRGTTDFPKGEQFGLISQMRRAAVSVPSNIAEGKERQSDKDFARFVAMALGSLAELETQLLLSGDLGYLAGPGLQTLLEQADEVGKMLRGLQKTLT
jgi:four helix bundle protein